MKKPPPILYNPRGLRSHWNYLRAAIERLLIQWRDGNAHREFREPEFLEKFTGLRLVDRCYIQEDRLTVDYRSGNAVGCYCFERARGS